MKTPLKVAFERFLASYPAFSKGVEARQPIHTVYGGAHLFHADTAVKLGRLSAKSFREHASDPAALAGVLGWTFAPEICADLFSRIERRLESGAVEDFRIDFEDGFGARPDAEEDDAARAAAREVALGLKQGTLPSLLGIRIKSFSPELVDRALRTLELFVATLAGETSGKLPGGFVVTLPKVVIPEQVALLAKALASLESRLGLAEKSIRLEIMVESPQLIVGADGRSALLACVQAGEGRCVAAHFGAYDYTSACGISAAHQGIGHPICDLARQMMQTVLAGTGVMLSDGANHILPVGTDRAAIHRVWRQNYELIRRSLIQGFYQGWDLHPTQIPIRYAAIYAFYAEGLDAATVRLKSYREKAAQAGLAGQVFDDAASAQGVFNFFARGIACGAITSEEAHRAGFSAGVGA